MNNKICAKCNRSNDAAMQFCLNCGAEFSQSSADDLPATVFGGNFDSFPPVGQNFQPPNQQSPNFQQPQFSPQTSLRIDFAGVWMLIDAKVEVYFDNQFIGTGSVKNGFSFNFAVGGGAHVLELKMALRSKRYDFVIPQSGNFLAQVNYSRATGNFESDLNFGRY